MNLGRAGTELAVGDTFVFNELAFGIPIAYKTSVDMTDRLSGHRVVHRSTKTAFDPTKHLPTNFPTNTSRPTSPESLIGSNGI